MLRTVEATFDPSSGVHFMEPVNVVKPMRILVTFMESGEQTPIPIKKDKRRTISEWLSSPPLGISARTPEEMNLYIKELRASWD